MTALGGDDSPPSARELGQALRHPDNSVIIDLSKMPHHHKSEYLGMLLPFLVTLRRQTGLPHKILLDEAHYYLGGPDSSRLIDSELAAYVLVTYRISALAPPVRMATDTVLMVTRETDPLEAQTIARMARPPASVSPGTFRDLATSEAALLPGSQESHGQVLRFKLAPRLTAHVRHRAKYLDMPVVDRQAFVFTDYGRQGPRAHTLKEFMGLLAALPSERIRAHLQRHDFSRWLGDVFRDNPLAVHVREIEARSAVDDATDIAADIAQSIRARYETAAERTVNPPSGGA